MKCNAVEVTPKILLELLGNSSNNSAISFLRKSYNGSFSELTFDSRLRI